MDVSLTPRERVLVMTLMALNEEVTNRRLKELTGLTIEGEAKRRLNEAGLVVSEKRGSSFHHRVDDDGWAWCWQEMARAVPDRADTGTRGLYVMLGRLRQYMDRTDVKLSDVFGPDPVEERIRAGYRQLATMPGEWVGLAKLRDLLDDVPRETADNTLRRLDRLPDVHLAPEPDQRQLTPADRAAAVDIGGKDNHLLRVDVP